MPLARLAILFVRVGDRKTKKGSIQESLQCPSCKKIAPALREKRWKDFRVLGIPLLTWQRRKTLLCSHCGEKISEQAASFLQSVFWHFI